MKELFVATEAKIFYLAFLQLLHGQLIPIPTGSFFAV